MLTWRGSWDVGRTACSRHSRLQPKPGCVKQACPQPTKHREAGFVGMPMAQLQESLRCSYCDFAVGLKLSSSENGSNTCENVDDGKSTCPIAYVLVCSAQPIYPARWLYDLSVFSICLFSHAIMKACNPRAALPLEQHSRGSRRKKLVRAAINIWVNSACCCQLAISPARFRRRTWQFAT